MDFDQITCNCRVIRPDRFCAWISLSDGGIVYIGNTETAGSVLFNLFTQRGCVSGEAADVGQTRVTRDTLDHPRFQQGPAAAAGGNQGSVIDIIQS